MSETYFVGTDVLLHFLTRDDPEKAERCKDLLTRAANGLITLEVTVQNVIQIVRELESNYSKQTIASRLPGLLRIPGILVHDREVLLQALTFYAQHDLSFEDACQMAHVMSSETRAIYSFADRFDRETQFRRLEP